MKKRVSALVFALALIFTISASAVSPRTINPMSHTERITASSSGVTCIVDITGSKLTASGTVTLYKNGSQVASWTVSSLYFSKTYTPGGKGNYRMDYDITVKGPNGTDRLTGSESDNY